MHQPVDASSVQQKIDQMREEEGGLMALLADIPSALAVLRGKIKAAEQLLMPWHGDDASENGL